MSEYSRLRKQSSVAEEQLCFLEDRQGNATGAQQENPLSVEAQQDSQMSTEQAKRKATTDARNRKRGNKRARMEMQNGPNQPQGTLQIFVVGGAPQEIKRAVPWEHRGLLGQTRDGRNGSRGTP